MSAIPSIFDPEKFELGMEVFNRLTKKRVPAGPTLHSVLEEIDPVPGQSVVIGACSDGLPVMMDLTNPRTGSILIIADPCSGKTDLLLSILNSACTTNPARNLRISFISSRPSQLSSLARLPHSYLMATVEATIDKFTAIAEERIESHAGGPAVLLAIDDLPAVMEQIHPVLADKLQWLITNGPAVQVRVIATAESDKLEALGEGVVDSFGAWLVGRMDNPQDGTNLALIPPETSRSLKPGSQFCVFFENDWIPFWVLK